MVDGARDTGGRPWHCKSSSARRCRPSERAFPSSAARRARDEGESFRLSSAGIAVGGLSRCTDGVRRRRRLFRRALLCQKRFGSGSGQCAACADDGQTARGDCRRWGGGIFRGHCLRGEARCGGRGDDLRGDGASFGEGARVGGRALQCHACVFRATGTREKISARGTGTDGCVS